MSIIKNFLKKTYLFQKIYFLNNKTSKRIISRSELNKSFAGNKLDTKLFNKKNLLSILENQTNSIPNSLSSVVGWVPYIKNKTNIVLYNFFSANYSIRNIVYVRISLVENLNIKMQKSFWLDANSIIEYELTEIANEINANSVVVELFNPRIPKHHGGHDGHLRFWGKYYNSKKDFLSTVHSMPLPKKTIL